MCLAQGYNAVTPVRLKPTAPRSRVNTLPLSHCAPPTILRNRNTSFDRNFDQQPLKYKTDFFIHIVSMHGIIHLNEKGL